MELYCTALILREHRIACHSPTSHQHFKSYRRNAQNSVVSTWLLALIADLKRDWRPLTVAEKDELKTPEAFERMKQMASVQARGAGSEEVSSTLAARGLAVALTPANKSFILGDHPLSRMGENSHFALTGLWFPISAHVAISPWGKAGLSDITACETIL